MKLRTDGQSIRLRLKRSEVAGFADTGRISARVPFPGRRLEFALECADVMELSAGFEGDCIRVLVPRLLAAQWTGGEEVGIYGRHEALSIVIEKDFRRTAGASPDDQDRYPNPRSPGAKQDLGSLSNESS